MEHTVPVAHAEAGVLAIECGWADDTDAATDPDGAGRLVDPVELGNRERIGHGLKLATHLFAADDQPPRYVLILAGGVVILADRLRRFSIQPKVLPFTASLPRPRGCPVRIRDEPGMGKITVSVSRVRRGCRCR